MDLRQVKLTKNEWDFLEKPVSKKELEILKLVFKSRKNINIFDNKSLTIASYMKLNDDEEFHKYLFDLYFKKEIMSINKKYNIKYEIKYKKNNKLKQKDLIRIKNSVKKIDKTTDLYEFLLIKNIKQFLKKNNNLKNYYTLTQLLKNNIYNINKYVLDYVNYILKTYKKK